MLVSDGCHRHRALAADATATTLHADGMATTLHAADDGHDARNIKVGAKAYCGHSNISNAFRTAQLLGI